MISDGVFQPVLDQVGYAGHASLFGHCAAAPRVARRAKRGGARRDRTADLVIANDALSQLSYGPMVAASTKDGAQQSAPFTIRAKVKSRTVKSRFSAAFAGNFPCLQGGEPISSSQSPPREPLPHARRSRHRSDRS